MLSKLGVQSNTLKKIVSFCSKTYTLIFFRIWAVYFKNMAKLLQQFCQNSSLHVQRNILNKSVSRLMDNHFFSWTSSKKSLFFGDTLSAWNRKQDSTYKEGRSWALIASPNLNNITKTGTKFAIFVFKKTHPSRGCYYFINLVMEENNSAAG